MSFNSLFSSEDVFSEPKLLEACSEIQTSADQVLVRQGDRGSDLFIVESGYLKVTDDKGDDEFILTLLAPKDVFGEMSFLDGAIRSATVTVAEPGIVHMLSREAFISLIEAEPVLGAKILRNLGQLLAKRLRAADISLCLLADDSETREKYELRRLIEEARRSVRQGRQNT